MEGLLDVIHAQQSKQSPPQGLGDAIILPAARWSAWSRGAIHGGGLGLVLIVICVGMTLGAFPTFALAASPPEIAELRTAHRNINDIEIGTTYANFFAVINTNGAETKYHCEYATSKSALEGGLGTIVPGSSGTIAASKVFAEPEFSLTGLSPETIYYLRCIAESKEGTTSSEFMGRVSGAPGFETITVHPQAAPPAIMNVSADSARLHGFIESRSFETQWRLEEASSASGPWMPILGGGGTISQTEASESRSETSFAFTGLEPATRYYVRLSADNGHGEATSQPIGFETAGPPHATTFATHTFAAGSETYRLLGSASADTAPVKEIQSVTVGEAPTGGSFTLGFEGQTTAPIPFDAVDNAVQQALEALPGIGASGVTVSRNPGGPYTVVFSGPKAGVDVPQLTADGSGLTPSGTVTVATLENGSSYDSHYHFEYVTQEDFEKEGGFARAHTVSTPEIDLGAGELENGEFTTNIVAVDVPELQPGISYRYRIAATNTTSGDPVVYGEAQTVSVPATTVASPETCPNEQLRTGASAGLPDCRAFEEVTPAEKGGTTEPFKYGIDFIPSSFVGEDGDHFILRSENVKWGESPSSSETSYLFSRDPVHGWQMTSINSGPLNAFENYTPSVMSPDLTRVAITADWTTVSNSSPEVNLIDGAFGGPYTHVSSIPRSKVPNSSKSIDPDAWIAASADFSKLVLWSEDRDLLGKATGTASGADLYEYTATTGLQQLNVGDSSPGATIGSCGAQIVYGFEGPHGGDLRRTSAHAVSADGARVFFEAVPGANCAEEKHLYMRVNGTETVDLRACVFLAANAKGSEVLCERSGGAGYEIVLYDTETLLATTLFSTPERLNAGASLVVSDDLAGLYFKSGSKLTSEAPPSLQDGQDENIYWYDIGTRTLRYVVQMSNPGNGENQSLFTTPSGQDLYFSAYEVTGVPGTRAEQVYRYDNVEDVIQCIACASSFDPVPRLGSVFAEESEAGVDRTVDGVPALTVSSANGDYVFFDALSALLPSDIDGETELKDVFSSESSVAYSSSSDVYEWRRDGVDGCVHAQGCLGLISAGQGGHLVMLLGTTPSGRDVFFTTNQRLVGQDKDTASDVYDARIDGGFAAAAKPVECEGDACSTPAAAPNDVTPASMTFSGEGNQPEVGATQKVESKKSVGHGRKRKQRTKARRTPRRSRKAARKKRVIRSSKGGRR